VGVIIGADAPRLHHAVQHPPRAAGEPAGGVLEAHLPRRGEHRREQRGLCSRELARGDPEVGARSGLGPEDAVPPLRHVQVERQDAPLGERALELERQHRLLRLAPQAPLGAEPQVLGELLRQGGGAAQRPPLAEAVVGGGLNLVPVEGAVRVEARVLRDQHRLDEPGGDVVQADPGLLRPEAPPGGPGLGAPLLDDRGGPGVLRGDRSGVGEGQPEPCRRRCQEGGGAADEEEEPTHPRRVHRNGGSRSPRLRGRAGSVPASPRDKEGSPRGRRARGPFWFLDPPRCRR